MWLHFCVASLLLAQSVVLGFPRGKPPRAKIEVCQNKDCCRQWNHQHQQGLPETIQDLLPPHADVDIEITGCLSQCGKGPNIMLRKTDGSQVCLNSVTGPMHVAQEVEEGLGIRVPSKLVAAVTVLEKARRATTIAEKERCLSSVIEVLQNDPLLRVSTTNIRAHVFRAEVRFDYGMIDESLRDISEALAVAPEINPDAKLVATLIGRAYRTRADCFLALRKKGEAEEALRQWAHFDPSRRTKAMKEIQLLRQSS